MLRNALSEPVLDCIIDGGGPAGLTAALYLGRFRRHVLLIDAGESRAAWIPVSHNQPSFPDGISGLDLLQRMKQQAERFGTEIRGSTRVDHIQPVGSEFLVEFADGSATTKTVLLATGVVNHRPDMSIDLHREAVARGLIRYCPICDGFEAMNQKIAVLGADGHGVDEALFLRTYSANITLLCARAIASAKMQQFAEAGIEIVNRPVTSIAIEQTRIVVGVESSTTGFAFDTLYPALGSSSNIELATRTGAAVSDRGCLIVDDHQMTTCAGVYAAGDVVEGLDQISVAAGQAAIAATAIHNRLRALEGR